MIIIAPVPAVGLRWPSWRKRCGGATRHFRGGKFWKAPALWRAAYNLWYVWGEEDWLMGRLEICSVIEKPKVHLWMGGSLLTTDPHLYAKFILEKKHLLGRDSWQQKQTEECRQRNSSLNVVWHGSVLLKRLAWKIACSHYIYIGLSWFHVAHDYVNSS